MNGVRAPAASGLFYPAEPAELAGTVDRLLASAPPPRLAGPVRALVVPHAGYPYSGAVAATAFAALPGDGRALRVTLLGPSHFVPLDGLAVTGARAWATPLGAAVVDADLRRAAVGAGASVDDLPHARDHALEVELPFLQRRVGDELRVLPVAVGAGVDGSASVLAALADDAVIVVSTDLSHYLDDASARARDRRTARAVVELDDGSIGGGDACGAHALRGLLLHARRSGWTCTLLGLRTSGDATGDRSRVVGYGAFAFTSAR